MGLACGDVMVMVVVLCVLAMEPEASCMSGKHATIMLYFLLLPPRAPGWILGIQHRSSQGPYMYAVSTYQLSGLLKPPETSSGPS